jgi:hypothetical protein
MAQLLKVTPHQNNDDPRVGECGHWDREPSKAQAAQFQSNEWPSLGARTLRHPEWVAGTRGADTSAGLGGLLWYVLIILVILGVCTGVWAGWQYIILPIASGVLK